ncbi:indeterminate(ID)-domain 7 [Actinidia rufa]|uniref:Indeterminate(ID)-domain 7 n=1 Tax=Actinidia rufa TaxID=165716 RepID=A0A7J0HCZ6_9ERIC|nr:indeterminate(ID)-domain 7 [Actinidia rufa]
MSNNFSQEFEEDLDDEQFHNGSPNHTENGDCSAPAATTTSKKKRNLPGNPGKPYILTIYLPFYPDAEVVALSPRTLMATNRKDSFVTHRAFCDALTEENYKMNQTLAAAGGMMLHNSNQELFSSSMPASDSNTIMNLSNSHDNNIDSIPPKPLSLNSHGSMISTDLDPIFNPRMPRPASFSSIGSGTNNSSLQAVGSMYTSATALLQKAAEMGAKISDSSITPILLRGFTGYSTSSNSLNSSGSVHNASNIPIAATTIGTNGLYVANMEAAGGDPRPGYNYVPQTGLYDESSLFPQPPSNGTATNLMERQVFMGGCDKMTVDFLGVEPSPAAAHSSFGKKRSYDGNIVMGLGYSNSHQGLHNLPEW